MEQAVRSTSIILISSLADDLHIEELLGTP
jgi:hypothetical protein